MKRKSLKNVMVIFYQLSENTAKRSESRICYIDDSDNFIIKQVNQNFYIEKRKFLQLQKYCLFSNKFP